MSKVPKFLFCTDEDNIELYILHRDYPVCLIHVEHTIPCSFTIEDVYDRVDEDTVKNHPFMKELKDYLQNKIKKCRETN